MTLSAAVRLLYQQKPKNLEAFRKLFKLITLKSGMYRKVFEVEGLPIIIKTSDCCGYSKCDHTSQEIKAIRYFNSQKDLRVYSPEVFYMDEGSGVVVMRKYEILSQYEPGKREALSKKKIEVEDFLRKKGIRPNDFHNGNTGFTKTGNVKIVDMGMFHYD